MRHYILSLKTQDDIDGIYLFTKTEFGQHQAIKYLLGLKSYFELLVKKPEIGKDRNEIKKGLFSFPYESHIIFYRVFKNHIRIISVLYGGRDIIKFLK